MIMFWFRRLLARVLIVLCLVLTVIPGCQTRTRTLPHEVSFEGLKLVVWDASQPLYPGSASWEEEVNDCVRAFSDKYRASVEVRFVTREEIRSAISGKSISDRVEDTDTPDLVYSTEWPIVSTSCAPVHDILDLNDLLDSTVSYWTKDAEVLGIPAYAHWFCAAARGSPGKISGDESTSDTDWVTEFRGKVSYWQESPAFFGPVAAFGLTEENILAYLQWVKSFCGPPVPDPLTSWQSEEVSVLFPVNPHLFRWLQTSGGRDDDIVPLALPGPSGEGGVFYTVPGYVVLAQTDPKKTCAALLGQALAQRLGQWAAWTFGGIPASSVDMSVFHLCSALSYEDRTRLTRAIQEGSLVAPDSAMEQVRAKVQSACADSILRYLQGFVSQEDLAQSIRRGLRGHTSP